MTRLPSSSWMSTGLMSFPCCRCVPRHPNRDSRQPGLSPADSPGGEGLGRHGPSAAVWARPSKSTAPTSATLAQTEAEGPCRPRPIRRVPRRYTPRVSRPAIDLERYLTSDQIAAVTHGEGPQLVLAGAGSGKTRVITYRISWLVEERGVDPGHIAAVTFTNKAAGEMRERVEELLGLHPLPGCVGTFHRSALLLLRRYGERVGVKRDFAVHDAADQLSLIKEALAAEGLSEGS